MNGFISYAHDDYKSHEEFRRHLEGVARAFSISFWSDKRIGTGYQWSKEILVNLEKSRIFILLVSASFIGSDYIFDKELPAINKTLAISKGLLLPVILERCAWQLVAETIQASPTTGGRLLPICDWRPRHHGYDCAREQITESVQRYFGLLPKNVKWDLT